MKAKFFAVAMSFFVVTLSAHAIVNKDLPGNKQPPLVTHKIDINNADLATLIGSVKGIGKKRAEAIISYRTSHNGFKSLQELSEVKGLGQRFVSANRDKLTEVFTINKVEKNQQTSS
jgi:competence protein ComEA